MQWKQFLYSHWFFKVPVPTGSFHGKTIIVTGAGQGLGLEASRHFVRLGAEKVILAVPRLETGEEAKRDIESSTQRPDVCEVWHLDLSVFDSVKEFVKRASKLPRIDVLLNNAGIAAYSVQFAEGHERTLTVNVIGPFLLSTLLLPQLKATASRYGTPTYISMVSSMSHQDGILPDAETIIEALDRQSEADMHGERYCQSKLLVTLIVRQWALQLQNSGVILNNLNPGLCHSDLLRDSKGFLKYAMKVMKLLFARTTEEGSRTLVAATMTGPESHGTYLDDCQPSSVGLSEFVRSEAGDRAGQRLLSELMSILEQIQPGLSIQG